MENAGKALEMAGSVLIGILILGCLVFAYNQLATVKQNEQVSKRVQQAADFNKDYLAYDRNNLYGSDIFSIANLISNYNIKEHEAKDYTEITISVKIKTKIIGAKYFDKGAGETYNANQITSAYKALSDDITKVGNKKYFNKAVSYWSKFGTKDRLVEQINQEVKNPNENMVANLKVDIQEYNDLVGEQKDMARKTFKCKNVEYDKNTGRVTKMEFEERG